MIAQGMRPSGRLCGCRNRHGRPSIGRWAVILVFVRPIQASCTRRWESHSRLFGGLVFVLRKHGSPGPVSHGAKQPSVWKSHSNSGDSRAYSIKGCPSHDRNMGEGYKQQAGTAYLSSNREHFTPRQYLLDISGVHGQPPSCSEGDKIALGA